MKTQSRLNGRTALALAGVVSGLTLTALGASPAGYRQANLVSDLAGVAQFTDANLINPWGILLGPGGQLIAADNHAGVATFYGLTGRPMPFDIGVPAPDGSAGGAVTDLAWNGWERSFLIGTGRKREASQLLFVTEDGTILGWNPKVNRSSAVLAVDNSGAGAIYKSLALAPTRQGPRLFAANFGQGVVEIYDGAFHLTKSFTDADLATVKYVPFGVRLIGERLFVTYAFKASPEDGDETAGPGLGYVDQFDLEGNLVRRFASQGTLDAPWGLALAPPHFGRFGGALLVGNFAEGTINAYHPDTGAFLGQLSDSQGNPIQIEGLWGLAFGPGPSGGALYFTAGPGDENHGLLGALLPGPAGHHADR